MFMYIVYIITGDLHLYITQLYLSVSPSACKENYCSPYFLESFNLSKEAESCFVLQYDRESKFGLFW